MSNKAYLENIAKEIVLRCHHGASVSDICSIVSEFITTEREACARVCDEAAEFNERKWAYNVVW